MHTYSPAPAPAPGMPRLVRRPLRACSKVCCAWPSSVSGIGAWTSNSWPRPSWPPADAWPGKAAVSVPCEPPQPQAHSRPAAPTARLCFQPADTCGARPGGPGQQPAAAAAAAGARVASTTCASAPSPTLPAHPRRRARARPAEPLALTAGYAPRQELARRTSVGERAGLRVHAPAGWCGCGDHGVGQRGGQCCTSAMRVHSSRAAHSRSAFHSARVT